MQTHCKSCQKGFQMSDEDLACLKKVSPVIGGNTMDIPPPTLCPDCRQHRRLTFRNDQHYYKNTCSACKKNVISIYSPDKGLPVLCATCFWSDQWDPLSFGMKPDFTRPFFEQYGEMRTQVPRLTLFNTQSDNCDYTVHSSSNRNCYMCSSTVRSENVYFCDWAIDCRDCIDLLICSNMELCSSCNESRHCYNCDWLDVCANMTDSAVCFDCQTSQNLVGCVSIKNGKDMILNKRAAQADVEATIRKLKTDSAFRADFQKKFDALKLSLPKREAVKLNTTDSSGDYLMNAKNARHCYHSMDLEDSAYIYDAITMRDCSDVTRASKGELLYECKGIIDLKNSAFCNLTYQCDRLLYCDNCHGSSECFGCFGVKKGRYCILNRQYSKEEYEALVPKLIEHMRSTGEWGEFFPTTLSAFGYNETKAFEWTPMTREQVLARGWQWSDYEQAIPEGLKPLDAHQLPEDISAVPDDILNYIIACEVTGKPFRLIPQELQFYRKKGLPVPHRSPQQRLRDLRSLQNPHELFARTCDKCGKDIETTYPPSRPEIVYCEECYLAEVY